MLFGKLAENDIQRSLNTSGIGLGLHICKKIVENFGGSINVQSKLNQGSIFTFTIITGN